MPKTSFSYILTKYLFRVCPYHIIREIDIIFDWRWKMQLDLDKSEKLTVLHRVSWGAYFWWDEQLYLKVNINIDHKQFKTIPGSSFVLLLSNETLLLMSDDNKVAIETDLLVLSYQKD